MARLVLMPAQRTHTGGVGEVEVAATDYRGAVAELLRLFPDLPLAEIDACNVAIDGELVDSPFLEPLAAGSRVVFVQRIGAG
jgi:hypothetical protein